MSYNGKILTVAVSHPSWVCGLKLKDIINGMTYDVTPFVGVWIETRATRRNGCPQCVTPFVGVWIETYNGKKYGITIAGHTLRGCVD